MALAQTRASCSCRAAGAFSAAPVRPVRVARARLVVSNSYKTLENVDLSKLGLYQRHDKDSGSSEVQVARLTARIEQISSHLAVNKKDFAARRGLEAILSQRKSLLQYVYKTDRALYSRLVGDFRIRSVVVKDTRGAARKRDDAPIAAVV